MSSNNLQIVDLPEVHKRILILGFTLAGIPTEAHDELILKTYLEAKKNLLLNKRKVTLDDILKTCASVCNVEISDMVCDSPKGYGKIARLMYFKLVDQYTLESQANIAEFVHISRSAYVLSLQRANDNYEIDKNFQTLYHICETHLLNLIS